ncbi:hypothetical protein O3P69_004246 [Scylla paramamosain]|uniref:Secreted protein n=1 Tax=Scylla paramamosain TaxID=85552 RepID=A0AAW0ULC0_SCYPA
MAEGLIMALVMVVEVVGKCPGEVWYMGTECVCPVGVLSCGEAESSLTRVPRNRAVASGYVVGDFWVTSPVLFRWCAVSSVLELGSMGSDIAASTFPSSVTALKKTVAPSSLGVRPWPRPRRGHQCRCYRHREGVFVHLSLGRATEVHTVSAVVSPVPCSDQSLATLAFWTRLHLQRRGPVHVFGSYRLFREAYNTGARDEE